MAKVIFISLPVHGHTNPTIRLVKYLKQKGEEVHYFTTRRFVDKFENLDIDLHFYEDFASETYELHKKDERFSLISGFVKLLKYMDKIYPDLKAEVLKIKPDYIIYDHVAYYGLFISRELKIPHICSCTVIGVKPSSIRIKDAVGLLETTSLTSLLDILEANKEILKFMIKNKMNPYYYRKVFDSYSDLNILYTARELQPKAETYDDSFVYIGPSVEEDITELPEELGFIKQHKTIYVSLGTSFNQHPEVYKEIIEGLKKYSDYRIIISMPKEVQESFGSSIPRDFLIYNYAPQKQILKYTKLFIGHGGFNGINESLFYGVPMILIPQMSEQEYNANIIEAKKLGLKINKNDLTSKTLSKKIDLVLSDNTYLTNAEKMGAIMQITTRSGNDLFWSKLNEFKLKHNIIS